MTLAMMTGTIATENGGVGVNAIATTITIWTTNDAIGNVTSRTLI